jgi:hypothetical protein
MESFTIEIAGETARFPQRCEAIKSANHACRRSSMVRAFVSHGGAPQDTIKRGPRNNTP